MISVALLVDPNETGGTALATNDIYKIYTALEPQTGVFAGIAYTKHWPEQPIIPNITADIATFNNPVIWLRQNQSETGIVVDGYKIYVSGKSQYGLDSAACRVSLVYIKKVLMC